MTGLIAGIAGQLLFASTDREGFKGFCIIASIIESLWSGLGLLGRNAE